MSLMALILISNQVAIQSPNQNIVAYHVQVASKSCLWYLVNKQRERNAVIISGK